MSGYPSEWQGSLSPDDRSGVGSWWVDGEQYVMVLPSFEVYQKIDKMLGIAHRMGREGGIEWISSVVKQAIERT